MSCNSNEQAICVHGFQLTELMQTELIVSNMAHAPTKSRPMHRHMHPVLRHCVQIIIVTFCDNCVSTETLSSHTKRSVDSFFVFFPDWPSVIQLHSASLQLYFIHTFINGADYHNSASLSTFILPFSSHHLRFNP